MTNQKMLVDNALIFSTSRVSIYSHAIARTETIGIEARIAPTKDLRWATSEIRTIKATVR